MENNVCMDCQFLSDDYHTCAKGHIAWVPDCNDFAEAKPVIPIKAAKARVKVQKYSDDEIIFYIHK